ncbi:hypothetical protein EBZ80_24815 [bacterium]|nr:hypothetical protein [bacterium]
MAVGSLLRWKKEAAVVLGPDNKQTGARLVGGTTEGKPCVSFQSRQMLTLKRQGDLAILLQLAEQRGRSS